MTEHAHLKDELGGTEGLLVLLRGRLRDMLGLGSACLGNSPMLMTVVLPFFSSLFLLCERRSDGD